MKLEDVISVLGAQAELSEVYIHSQSSFHSSNLIGREALHLQMS